MSVSYTSVGWTPAKKAYDVTIAAGLAVYLGLFVGVGAVAHRDATIETLLIRALATAAFVMLHVILSIGPLCRLSPRFLPLLYNRRHLGVTMFLVALSHAVFAIVQFHALGNVNPLVSLLTTGTGFQTFGLAALIVLFLMAATSHDFWLANLTPRVWKILHMGVYFAYASIVVHVALGALHAESHPVLAVATALGMVWLLALHVIAGLRERAGDVDAVPVENGWIDAGPVEDIPDGRARIVCAGERIAIFRYDGKVSAVSNVCRHQNGPLGEGRVIDGCITCPWHGYQYVPGNGRSPAPFTEKVATFDVRVVGGRAYVNRNAHAPERRWSLPVSDEFFVGYLPMPPATARRMRRTAAAVVMLAAVTAAALAIATGPFDRAAYDYASAREWQGILESAPVPVLIAGAVRFPVVAEGKHGAAASIAGHEGGAVRLMGRRIMRGGTTMIELVPGTIQPLPSGTPAASTIEDLGQARFSGEIVDSKCFLGVMNPGRLEVHRACAKRCIAGGIPPMLYTHDDQGRELHLLLVDADGQPVNDRVLPLVARPISLAGRLERRDGLHYLYVSMWP